MARKRSTTKEPSRRGTRAIGTWPTPERPTRKKKAAARKTTKNVSLKKRARRTSPRAIDTVPLPEKPRKRKRASRKKKAVKKSR